MERDIQPKILYLKAEESIVPIGCHVFNARHRVSGHRLCHTGVDFVWVARLLAHRAQEKELAGKAEAAQPEVEAEGVEAAEEIEGPELVQGRGSSANYGLLLGALSCGLYWISPLVMAMAFIGSFYSLRALVIGVRHFRIVIWRAALGLLLNIGGIALQFLLLLEIIPPLV
jgi:hypothetical protein